MSVSFICPLCRRRDTKRRWMLKRRPGLLRCSNPSCEGRFTTKPFPILHHEPGKLFERMSDTHYHVSLSALGLILRTLPRDSTMLHVMRKRSRAIWHNYHDLLSESYCPDFVHPAPFALRALSMLERAQLKPGAKALVAGSGPGRASYELALMLRKNIQPETKPNPDAKSELSNAPSPESTLPVFYPEVFALDVDPAMHQLFQAFSKGTVPVLLRASNDNWHSPEPLELPRALRHVSDLIHPVCGDLLAPPFPDESFDLIVAFNVLERVHDPLALLYIFQDMLAPGGFLLLSSSFAWRKDMAPDKTLHAAVPHLRLDNSELIQKLLAGKLITKPSLSFHQIAVMEPVPNFQRVHDALLHTYMAHVSLWQKPRTSS